MNEVINVPRKGSQVPMAIKDPSSDELMSLMRRSKRLLLPTL